MLEQIDFIKNLINSKYCPILSLVPSATLLQALNSFLSLNPDVHLLPLAMLIHLSVLYAVSDPTD